MSRELPLFPLPGVVLLPGTLLPLHIFEPRYRDMVADALSGNRLIGMSMLKPGFEDDDGSSPIYPVGGAGEIVESEALEDGRYNILLEGRFRYRVLTELPAGPYRIARVEEVAALPFSSVEEEARVGELASQIFAGIRPDLDLPALPPEEMATERLASEIALRLRYGPQDLQAILETNSLPGRFATLIGRMLEWQKRMEFLGPFRPPDLDSNRN